MHPGVSYPLERIVPRGGATLCGHNLPAGTTLGVNPAVIHRDKSIFGDDADEFCPERWDPRMSTRDIQNMDRHLLMVSTFVIIFSVIHPLRRGKSPWLTTVVQFGAGARTCIGKNISIMEMGKVTPQVLRKFDLEWVSPKSTWEVKTWWFARQSGMLFKFTPRKRP
jgi:cytochrome P450